MRLELLASSEGEQPPDQLAPLLGGTLRHAEDLTMILIERDPFVEKAEATDHGCKQVVEIVRDAPSQLSDRIHLLGVDQLAFERTLLRNVGDGSREFHGPAVAIPKQHGLIEEMLVGSVNALPAELD